LPDNSTPRLDYSIIRQAEHSRGGDRLLAPIVRRIRLLGWAVNQASRRTATWSLSAPRSLADAERQRAAVAHAVRQDQYAATFGGVNYMEFYKEDKVIVNPLRVKQQYLFELENNLLLYYTATSRESARIIEVQSRNVTDKKEKSIEAMHQLKHQAQLMKEALLMGRIHEIGEILDFGFRQKQKMADGISNALIDDVYERARKAGATGGKISGAGGGGFMTFYCPGIAKYRVMEVLSGLGGHCQPYQFTGHGLTTWTV